MPEIELTKGKVAIVSDEDFEYLSQWKWFANRYATRKPTVAPNKQFSLSMHRVVIERMTGRLPPEGYETDHINGNPLDNRRENLRVVTISQNKMNRRGAQGKTSQYKGVSWDKRKKKWDTRIFVNKKNLRLGYYGEEIAAARAYDKAAREHFGEYAYLNFPEEQAQ